MYIYVNKLKNIIYPFNHYIYILRLFGYLDCQCHTHRPTVNTFLSFPKILSIFLGLFCSLADTAHIPIWSGPIGETILGPNNYHSFKLLRRLLVANNFQIFIHAHIHTVGKFKFS